MIEGPLSSATCLPMFMQFTGCHQPVQHSYWPENAIDCMAEKMYIFPGCIAKND